VIYERISIAAWCGFIAGVARGVTIILNNGHISDSILYYSANLVIGMSPAAFIVVLLILYIFFTVCISSSSGMALLTIPITSGLAVIVNVPGREIVNAYLFGMASWDLLPLPDSSYPLLPWLT
jgi:uncharacterized ion transporter superfamily protein YfcC